MINLEFRDKDGKTIKMEYDITDEGNRDITIPVGAISVHVWLGTK